MGKNPNAARDKKKHHKEKDQGEDRLAEQTEEAARLGCELWEVEEYQRKEREALGIKESESDSEEETK